MNAPKCLLPLTFSLLGAFCDVSQGLATPILGTAQSFSVLGATPSVTNTGATTLTGDVGVYPALSITGLSTITVNGTNGAVSGNPFVHLGDATAQQAQFDVDATHAYGALAALPSPGANNLTGQTLGVGTAATLSPGVYHFDTTAQLTGSLTLDFGATPDALFVFQIGTALTTDSASVVNVLNGGTNSGVYWLMGVTGGSGTGAATLGSGTVFAGNILALDTISFGSTAEILCGRAISLNAAVTMIGNTISNDCDAFNGGTERSDFGSIGFSGSGSSNDVGQTAPEPATLALLGLALAGFGFTRRRHG